MLGDALKQLKDRKKQVLASIKELNAEIASIDRTIAKAEAVEKDLSELKLEGAAKPKPVARKRTMSKAGRARIAAAQKARWANRKEKQAPVAVVPAKPVVVAKPAKSKGVSAAARAAMSAASKARWAKIKAAKAPAKK